MNIGEHLTQPGILKIINLKASLNRGLPDKLKEEWLNITPADRPTVLSSPTLFFFLLLKIIQKKKQRISND